MVKRTTAILLALCLGLALSACGGESADSPPPTASPEPPSASAALTEPPKAWEPDLTALGLELEGGEHRISCADGENTMEYVVYSAASVFGGPGGTDRISYNGGHYGFIRRVAGDGQVLLTLTGDPAGEWNGAAVTSASTAEAEPQAVVLAAFYEDPHTPPEGFKILEECWSAGYSMPAEEPGYSAGKLAVSVWPKRFGEATFTENLPEGGEIKTENGAEWYLSEYAGGWDENEGRTLVLLCRTEEMVVRLIGKQYSAGFPLEELVTLQMALDAVAACGG